MDVIEASAMDVIRVSRETTGLSDSQHEGVNRELICALLRRAAGIFCPCSPSTLRTSLLESLQYLAKQAVSLRECIDDGIGDLIVVGDLLEVNEVATTDPAVRDTWVFGAPPSFVVRPSGKIFIIGIVPDQDTLLPYTIAGRLQVEGNMRTITPKGSEDVREELVAHGFRELSARAWLKAPREQRPEELLDAIESRLSVQPPCGDIDGLIILDTDRPVNYYRGRWKAPTNDSGWFVGRRPQEFGSDLWCVVELNSGRPVRLLDLPPSTSRWRGCDVAWHIQMAVDQRRGAPQEYRRGVEEEGVRFDLLSPVPQWAQRRLMSVGETVEPHGSISSYVVPETEAATEEAFLKDMLWMERAGESK